MDIRIENESEFLKNKNLNKIITALNEKNIYTVNDLINANVEELFKKSTNKKFYLTLKKLYEAKYLNKKLDNEYVFFQTFTFLEKNKFETYISNLGFESRFQMYFAEAMKKNKTISIYNLFLELRTQKDKEGILAEYYLEYINKIIEENKINTDIELEYLLLRREYEEILKEYTEILKRKNGIEEQLLNLENKLNENNLKK